MRKEMKDLLSSNKRLLIRPLRLCASVWNFFMLARGTP